MNEVAAREQIVDIGRSLFARDYVHGTAGNISIRLNDGRILITATDASMAHLCPDEIAVVDGEGRHLGGPRASKTISLHRSIYCASEDTSCIIHTHSRALVAVSMGKVWKQQDILPPITPYQVMKVGHVPLIQYLRPGDPEIAKRVTNAITSFRTRGLVLRAIMLERLGPVVWHDKPLLAEALLQELEETAKLWITSGQRITPLGDEKIEELKDVFSAPW